MKSARRQRPFRRRTTPGVVGGRPLRKNRHTLTPNYRLAEQPWLVVDRDRPGSGYRHVLRRADIENFIALIADWGELSIGLKAIVLAERDSSYFGWYDQRGIIFICAWERDLWIELPQSFFEEKHSVFDGLQIDCELRRTVVLCKFNEEQVRAFQLLEVFLHELGHHVDRMATKSRLHCARGEGYAECFARSLQSAVWERYMERFGPV
jgi:hypothetical protein